MNKIHNYGQASLAPKVSPEFVGDLQAPTPGTLDNSTTLATKSFIDNSLQAFSYYYRPCYNVQSVATQGADSVDTVIDSVGNVYWSIGNYVDGTTYNLTAKIYKITPTGAISQFASVATNGARGTSLAFDANGNLYWAVINQFNGTTYNLTSNVYKITPAGTLTTFASTGTLGAQRTKLVFDTSGNLYWAVANAFDGTTTNLSSYIYKITPGGALTTFSTVSTTNAAGTDLNFSASGQLYWSINGTLYKVSVGGVATSFATIANNSFYNQSFVIDSADNVYWAVKNVIYKVTAAGVVSTLITVGEGNLCDAGSKIVLDSDGNLLWAITVQSAPSYIGNANLAKVNVLTGEISIIANVWIIQPTGPTGTSISIDKDGNIYWPVGCYYDGISNYNLNSKMHFISKVSAF